MIMKTSTTLGVAALAACATAYLASAAPRAASSTAPVSAAPAPVEGKVTGHVKYDGTPPEIKPLAITDEQAKGCCPPGKQVNSKNPELLVDASGGIANVVVTIESPGAKVEPPKEALHIDQHECTFEPHVRVIPIGGKLEFLNSDQVSHNVHTYAQRNDPFNQTIAPGSKEERVLSKDEKFQVKCDIHPWMSSWVFVTDTPYFAVTKADGSFEISGLKPGKYKVELWHEKLGKGHAEVVVKDDGSSAPVEAKMSEKKKH